MGGDDARRSRPTLRFENRDLVALTRKPLVPEPDDDPFAEWNEPVVAVGSQPAAAPTTSRTTTLHDPLTTGLLAEVARRTSTVEIAPDTIETARRTRTVEIDDETLEIARAAASDDAPRAIANPTKHRR